MLSGLPNYQMSGYRNFVVLVELQPEGPLFIKQASVHVFFKKQIICGQTNIWFEAVVHVWFGA